METESFIVLGFYTILAGAILMSASMVGFVTKSLWYIIPLLFGYFAFAYAYFKVTSKLSEISKTERR